MTVARKRLATVGGPEPWRPTVAHLRATVGAVTLVGVALVFRRPDVLVLATPLVAVAGWSVGRRPSGAPVLVEGVASPTVREGDATAWRARLTGADHADVVGATLDGSPWVQRRPASGGVTAAVAAGEARLAIGLRCTRWGRRELPRVTVTASSPWGAYVWRVRTARHGLVTLPVSPPLDLRAPDRPGEGLIGLHRSAGAGEGAEFAGVRPFQAGDRLRRVNWPRSLRTDTLQVDATWADIDTHVALVVDAAHDVGDSGGVDGAASSLDAAVRAAGAIAEHYTSRGDRVSLRTVGASPPASVPVGTGQAHLRRVLDTLAGVVTDGQVGYPARRRPHRADGQVSVLLSPLLAPEALADAVALGRRGRPVVVVDTLPDHVHADDDERVVLAWRIRMLERRRELRVAGEVGVPIVPWEGPGSLDAVLHLLARRSSAPRMRR